MAIDGEISIVKTAGTSCFIHLRSSWHHDSWSHPGQPFLMIKDYTFKPRVGQIVWGSDSIFIEPGMGISERHEYRRYRTLRMVEVQPYLDTDEAVNDYLRRHGYDPDKVGREMADFAQKAIEAVRKRNKFGQLGRHMFDI